MISTRLAIIVFTVNCISLFLFTAVLMVVQRFLCEILNLYPYLSINIIL